MSELLNDDNRKIHLLKGLIKGIQMGLDVTETRRKFSELLKGITTDDITTAEKELVKEGVDPVELDRMHEDIVSLLTGPVPSEEELAPPGHPIKILMAEHALMLKLASDLVNAAVQLKSDGSMDKNDENYKSLDRIIGHFKQSASHYLREENILFPYIEKHGLTGPPRAMWMEHDNIRDAEKELFEVMDSIEDDDSLNKLAEVANSLLAMLQEHYNKENNILFPAAMRLLEELEWIEIRNQFDSMGYTDFTPADVCVPMEGQADIEDYKHAEGGFVGDTGELSGEQIDAILNTLPFDITFIDETDTFCYFNKPPDQLFPRTRAALGRKVQNCHPEKSVHLVNQILTEFRSGERNMADFWIDMGGKKVYIRYFPVRDKAGKYLGCIEVTQDIAEIQKIEGQKRLL